MLWQKLQERDYRRPSTGIPPWLPAEVTVTAHRKDASSKGFRLLAGYIFGGNALARGREINILQVLPASQAALPSNPPRDAINAVDRLAICLERGPDRPSASNKSAYEWDKFMGIVSCSTLSKIFYNLISYAAKRC